MADKKRESFLTRVLNGLSIGIVVALVPGALLGEISKLLLPYLPVMANVIAATNMAQRLLPMVIGVCIAMMFRFTPIQTASVGIATVIGSGVAVAGANGSFAFAGTGDVINAGLTAALAAYLVQLLGNRLKAYTVLLVPTLVITIAGLTGAATLPYVKLITAAIGVVVQNFTVLQPVLMGSLIAVSFALLIVSPISTVAVATAISLSGAGSGAANLGIVAAGFGLAIAGWHTNSMATSIAHFLGSPKVQMANFMRKPKMILPVVCNAAVLGGLAGLLNLPGTPMSAGFGISGLIGPVNALNLMEGGWSVRNLIVVGLVFVVIPIALGLVFTRLFTKVQVVQAEDYQLSFE